MPGEGEQLYSQFADEQKLQSQHDFILALFADIEKGVNKLSGIGLDLKAAKNIKQVDKATAEYNATVKETNKFINDYYTTQAKAEIVKQKEFAILQQQKSALKDFNKEQQLRLKLANSIETDAGQGASLKTLNLQYEKATLILSKLNATQRETSRATGLTKFAEDTKRKIGELNAKVLNFKDQVGNYSNALAGGFQKVADEIEKLKVKQQGLQNLSQSNPIGFKTGGGDVELKKTTAALEQLNQVNQIGFKTGQSYTATVKQLTNAYKALETEGNVSNEFVEDFAKFVAHAKKESSELSNEIKLIGSKTRGIDLLVGSVSSLANVLEISAGASALLGSDTEHIEKSIQKLVAIQSVANGVREFGKQITERETAANKAYNFVIQQGAILFGKGSTAAQRFGVALKGIVILAVIGFIIDLISKLSDTDDSAEKAQKSVDELNNSLENFKKILASLNKEGEYDFQSRIEKIKKENAERLKLAKSDTEKQKIELENKKKLYDEEVRYKAKQRDDLVIQEQNSNAQVLEEQKKFNDAKAKIDEYNDKKTGINRFRKISVGGKSIDELKGDRDLAQQRLDIVKKENDEIRQAKLDAQRDLNLLTFKGNTDAAEAEADAAEKRRAKQKEYAEKERNAAFELSKYRLQLIIDANKSYADNEDNLVVNSRINAAKVAADAEIQLAILTRKHLLGQENITKSERIKIEEEYAAEVRDINFNLEKQIVDIRVNSIEKQREISKNLRAYLKQRSEEEFQVKSEEAQKSFEKEQAQLEIYHQQDLQRAQQSFKAGLLTVKEYNEKKEKYDLDYQRNVLNSQIRFYEKQVELLKAGGQDTTALVAAIQKAKTELADIDIGKTTASNDKNAEFKKRELEFADQLKAKYEELGESIKNAFESVVTGIFERRKNQIQDQMDLIDQQKEKEVDAINKSTLADQQKADKIAIIEANAANRKEALERRQRQIDRQKAIAQRAFQIFDIASSTIKDVAKIKAAAAVAYGEVVASTGGNVGQANLIRGQILAQIIPTVAASALAIAGLLAQDIPKYYTGVDYSPETDALIADRGRELRVDPDGRMRMYDKPSFVHLAEGSQIFSNQATEDILAAAQHGKISHFISIIANNVENKDDEILEELRKLNSKPPITIRNERGVESTVYYNYHMKQ